MWGGVTGHEGLVCWDLSIVNFVFWVDFDLYFDPTIAYPTDSCFVSFTYSYNGIFADRFQIVVNYQPLCPPGRRCPSCSFDVASSLPRCRLDVSIDSITKVSSPNYLFGDTIFLHVVNYAPEVSGSLSYQVVIESPNPNLVGSQAIIPSINELGTDDYGFPFSIVQVRLPAVELASATVSFTNSFVIQIFGSNNSLLYTNTLQGTVDCASLQYSIKSTIDHWENIAGCHSTGVICKSPFQGPTCADTVGTLTPQNSQGIYYAGASISFPDANSSSQYYKLISIPLYNGAQDNNAVENSILVTEPTFISSLTKLPAPSPDDNYIIPTSQYFIIAIQPCDSFGNAQGLRQLIGVITYGNGCGVVDVIDPIQFRQPCYGPNTRACYLQGYFDPSYQGNYCLCKRDLGVPAKYFGPQCQAEIELWSNNGFMGLIIAPGYPHPNAIYAANDVETLYPLNTNHYTVIPASFVMPLKLRFPQDDFSTGINQSKQDYEIMNDPDFISHSGPLLFSTKETKDDSSLPCGLNGLPSMKYDSFTPSLVIGDPMWCMCSSEYFGPRCEYKLIFTPPPFDPITQQASWTWGTTVTLTFSSSIVSSPDLPFSSPDAPFLLRLFFEQIPDTEIGHSSSDLLLSITAPISNLSYTFTIPSTASSQTFSQVSLSLNENKLERYHVVGQIIGPNDSCTTLRDQFDTTCPALSLCKLPTSPQTTTTIHEACSECLSGAFTPTGSGDTEKYCAGRVFIYGAYADDFSRSIILQPDTQIAVQLSSGIDLVNPLNEINQLTGSISVEGSDKKSPLISIIQQPSTPSVWIITIPPFTFSTTEKVTSVLLLLSYKGTPIYRTRGVAFEDICDMGSLFNVSCNPDYTQSCRYSGPSFTISPSPSYNVVTPQLPQNQLICNCITTDDGALHFGKQCEIQIKSIPSLKELNVLTGTQISLHSLASDISFTITSAPSTPIISSDTPFSSVKTTQSRGSAFASLLFSGREINWTVPGMQSSVSVTVGTSMVVNLQSVDPHGNPNVLSTGNDCVSACSTTMGSDTVCFNDPALNPLTCGCAGASGTNNGYYWNNDCSKTMEVSIRPGTAVKFTLPTLTHLNGAPFDQIKDYFWGQTIEISVIGEITQHFELYFAGLLILTSSNNFPPHPYIIDNVSLPSQSSILSQNQRFYPNIQNVFSAKADNGYANNVIKSSLTSVSDICTWYSKVFEPASEARYACSLEGTANCMVLDPDTPLESVCQCHTKVVDEVNKTNMIYFGQYCEHKVILPHGPTVYPGYQLPIHITTAFGYPALRKSTISFFIHSSYGSGSGTRSWQLPLARSSDSLYIIPDVPSVMSSTLDEPDLNSAKPTHSHYLAFNLDLGGTIVLGGRAVASTMIVNPCYWTILTHYRLTCYNSPGTLAGTNLSTRGTTSCLNPSTGDIKCQCANGYNGPQCNIKAELTTKPSTATNFYYGTDIIDVSVNILPHPRSRNTRNLFCEDIPFSSHSNDFPITVQRKDNNPFVCTVTGLAPSFDILQLPTNDESFGDITITGAQYGIFGNLPFYTSAQATTIFTTSTGISCGALGMNSIYTGCNCPRWYTGPDCSWFIDLVIDSTPVGGVTQLGKPSGNSSQLKNYYRHYRPALPQQPHNDIDGLGWTFSALFKPLLVSTINDPTKRKVQPPDMRYVKLKLGPTPTSSLLVDLNTIKVNGADEWVISTQDMDKNLQLNGDIGSYDDIYLWLHVETPNQAVQIYKLFSEKFTLNAYSTATSVHPRNQSTVTGIYTVFRNDGGGYPFESSSLRPFQGYRCLQGHYQACNKYLQTQHDYTISDIISSPGRLLFQYNSATNSLQSDIGMTLVPIVPNLALSSLVKLDMSTFGFMDYTTTTPMSDLGISDNAFDFNLIMTPETSQSPGRQLSVRNLGRVTFRTSNLDKASAIGYPLSSSLTSTIDLNMKTLTQTHHLETPNGVFIGGDNIIITIPVSLLPQSSYTDSTTFLSITIEYYPVSSTTNIPSNKSIVVFTKKLKPVQFQSEYELVIPTLGLNKRQHVFIKLAVPTFGGTTITNTQIVSTPFAVLPLCYHYIQRTPGDYISLNNWPTQCTGNKYCSSQTNQCQCRPGFSGDNCDITQTTTAPPTTTTPPTSTITPNPIFPPVVNNPYDPTGTTTGTVTIINNPPPSPCSQCTLSNTQLCNDGTPASVIGSSGATPEYNVCQCKDGWGGDTCSVQYGCDKLSVKKCSAPHGFLNPPLNSGQCGDTCTCVNQWAGLKCQTCELQCRHGEPWSGCDICGCQEGYHGDRCECLGLVGNVTVYNAYNPDLYKIETYLNSLSAIPNRIDASLLPAELGENYDVATIAAQLSQVLFSDLLNFETASSVSVTKMSTFDNNKSTSASNSSPALATKFTLFIKYGCPTWNPTVTDKEGVEKQWNTMLDTLLLDKRIYQILQFDNGIKAIEQDPNGAVTEVSPLQPNPMTLPPIDMIAQNHSFTTSSLSSWVMMSMMMFTLFIDFIV